MAKKATSKQAGGSTSKTSGRYVKSCATLAQAPIERSERREDAKSRRAQPSADELGLRAWNTTYENRRNNG
jgi:hypothetical protein